MVSPSRCTSFGVEVLEDLGRLLLAERHQQDRRVLEALFVERSCARCSTAAAQADAVRPPTQPRTMLGDAPAPGCRVARQRGAAPVQLLARPSARGSAAAEPARRRDASASSRVAGPAAALRRRRATRPSAPAAPGRRTTSSATSGTPRARAGAQQVEQPRAASTAAARHAVDRLDLERRVDHLHRVAALLARSRSLSRTSAVSLSSSSAASGARSSCPSRR